MVTLEQYKSKLVEAEYTERTVGEYVKVMSYVLTNPQWKEIESSFHGVTVEEIRDLATSLYRKGFIPYQQTPYGHRKLSQALSMYFAIKAGRSARNHFFWYSRKYKVQDTPVVYDKFFAYLMDHDRLSSELARSHVYRLRSARDDVFGSIIFDNLCKTEPDERKIVDVYEHTRGVTLSRNARSDLRSSISRWRSFISL